MPPIPDPSNIWTPDVIATVIYRVIMIIVSLAFIWRAYRQPVNQLHDESVVGLILNSESTRNPSTLSSSAHPPNVRSMLHDFMTAQLDSILQSTIGVGGESNTLLPQMMGSNGHNKPSITCSNTSTVSVDGSLEEKNELVGRKVSTDKKRSDAKSKDAEK
ncbi:hypothetical protein LSUE1_G001413 [Lachnellula suecica]|uniref:Uncharacterized protein n=1 Tax=Lachnellula suecica TaxID=602035 RepID=A0A8T9CBI7_9HELO|nr:hypothetical protein LSUE1_G001413 [Lachnellula suecica]